MVEVANMITWVWFRSTLSFKFNCHSSSYSPWNLSHTNGECILKLNLNWGHVRHCRDSITTQENYISKLEENQLRFEKFCCMCLLSHTCGSQVICKKIKRCLFCLNVAFCFEVTIFVVKDARLCKSLILFIC